MQFAPRRVVRRLAVVVEEGRAAKRFNDPRVSAWLAGYRRAASVTAPRSGASDPLALYVRPAVAEPVSCGRIGETDGPASP